MSTTTKARTTHCEALITQFGNAYYVGKRNLEGVSHQDSLIQPKEAGNCINWVMGHVVNARSDLLGVIGQKPVWDEQRAAPYLRHGPPLTDASKALPFDEIMADFDKTQERLTEGLAQVTEDQLSQKAPYSPTENPDETIGSLLGTFAFHDAYHIGQTGVLRRIVGKAAAGL